ncbi:type II secretion system protein [bacterium]|nr:type II secretion system protein [bacterium]
MTNKLNQFTTHSSQFTNFAFTLAETLIVMGIIGVVAALTLPNLNSSTGDKEKVAKVKKVYSNLNDAMGRAIAVYGPFNEWFTNDNSRTTQVTRFASRMEEFLKVSKDCGTSGTGCFVSNATAHKNYSGNTVDATLTGTNYYRFILADGTALLFGLTRESSETYTYPIIYIDIDGPNKGSGTSAKDIFAFVVNQTTGEITPRGSADSSSDLLTCGCLHNGYTECTAWVVMHDNMDYLKTNTSGQCTNNTSIKLDGITNTSCK